MKTKIEARQGLMYGVLWGDNGNLVMEDIVYQRWIHYNCSDLDAHLDCYWMILD